MFFALSLQRIIIKKQREAGAPILKKKHLVFAGFFLGVLLRAEPVESYAFLTRLNLLEQSLISFSRYYLLTEAFPHRYLYPLRMHIGYETYERTMRQMTGDLKGGEKRKLLTRFVDAKNLMHDLLSLENPPENFARLLRERVRLEEGIQRVAETMTLALGPEERVMYALAQMHMVLEGIALDYTVGWYRDREKKEAEAALKAQIALFERLARLCSTYAYWNTKERAKGKRILSAWKVLKTNLARPGRPLLVHLGAEHIETLLDDVRSQHEEEQ